MRHSIKGFRGILSVICMLSLFPAVGYAQQTMLMGKVTDGNNKPVQEVTIFLTSRDNKSVAVSDNMGLFTSGLLPDGEYKVTIIAGKKERKGGKIKLSSTTKQYFCFTLDGNRKVTTTVTALNPYMEAKLDEVAKNGHRIDIPKNNPGRIYHLQSPAKVNVVDSSSIPMMEAPQTK